MEKEIILSVNNFNGPLDLLYQLIKGRKFDILSLDLLYVSNIYLEYVNEFISQIKVDEVTYYISLISYMIELKSKKILPVFQNNNDIDEEIERDKFIQRILLSSRFKDVAQTLNEKFEDRLHMISCDLTIDNFYKPQQKIVEEIPQSISVKLLHNAIKRVYKNNIMINNAIRNITLKELSIDEVSIIIIEALENILAFEIDIDMLFSKIDNKLLTSQFLAVAFVALLILVKNGAIKLKQDIINNDNILIQKINLDLAKNISENKNFFEGAENE